jgi:hypothetical protein
MEFAELQSPGLETLLLGVFAPARVVLRLRASLFADHLPHHTALKSIVPWIVRETAVARMPPRAVEGCMYTVSRSYSYSRFGRP